MNAIFSNFNNVGEFNYSIHISPEFRFIYFNNPKCACTTVKASLNLACATALGRHLEYKNIGDIHNRNQNILLTPAQVGYATFREILEDPSYFKFCFIREPIQRIASAFASKLTWGSKSLSTLNRSLHRSDCALVTFDEFISLLLSDARIRDVDEHWRLQRKQVCFDLVRFDKIGLFENIEIDLKMILERVFGATVGVFDVRRHFLGNTSNACTMVQTLTREMQTAIRTIYEEDVELYRAVCTARN